MNPRVKKVVAQDNFTLFVYFSNGEEGIFDVKPLLHLPVFQPINERSAFAKVTMGNGNTVCWGDEIDICPDTIYLDSVKINE